MAKSHPVAAKFHPLKKVHAEHDCLIGTSRYDLNGGVMFVYRDQRNGNIGMSRPCDSCQFLMRRVGIKGAFYTDPNIPGNIGYIDLRYNQSVERKYENTQNSIRMVL